MAKVYLLAVQKPNAHSGFAGAEYSGVVPADSQDWTQIVYVNMRYNKNL